jgi:hypothetical protein
VLSRGRPPRWTPNGPRERRSPGAGKNIVVGTSVDRISASRSGTCPACLRETGLPDHAPPDFTFDVKLHRLPPRDTSHVRPNRSPRACEACGGWSGDARPADRTSDVRAHRPNSRAAAGAGQVELIRASAHARLPSVEHTRSRNSDRYSVRLRPCLARSSSATARGSAPGADAPVVQSHRRGVRLCRRSGGRRAARDAST